jgi:DNA primase
MVDADLNREVIGRVREAADLVEVVGEHVRLRKRGRTWEGLCPFHEEKTPSFSVDPDKGLYYCFGCHQGGDVFKFVMQLEHLSFPETVERLARRFGVQLPPRSPQARRRREEGERIKPLLEEAQRFFASRLDEAAGAAARAELERRGFAKDTWRSFGFGFAPDDWRCLLEHLTRRHPEGVVVESGLAVRPEGGTPPYDRFRNRLTFPIRSGDGALIAFGGRILGDDEPKYLNSPESPVFSKRSTLFCLDRARRSIASEGSVLVVEGYFDCLSLHRVGIENAVATLGTALTLEHGRVLRRRLGADGLALLCYDADDAGRRAAAAGAGVLLEAGVEVAIVVLPAGMDPDDVVRERGPEAFTELMEHPTSLLDFLTGDLPPEPARRRKTGFKLAPLVCSASDPALRRNLIEELARRLYLQPFEIEERGRQPRRRPAAPTTTQARTPAPPGERELARIVLECPGGWRAKILDAVEPALIADDRIRRLIEEAAAVVEREGPDADLAAELLNAESGADTSTFLAELCNTRMPEITDETIRVQLRALEQRQARERARQLGPLIEAAEQRGDAEELDRLLAEKTKIWRNSAKL